MQPPVTQDCFQRWFSSGSEILAVCIKVRGDYLTCSRMAGSKGHEAKRCNILAGQWSHWGHRWSPDSDPNKREWAAKSWKKLQAKELCEKVSICSMLDTAQDKQVKFKPQKDSQSSCLKFFQTEDYHLTILKVWEIVNFVVYPTTVQQIISRTATRLAETQLVAA